jgi:hypothetical protein
LLPFGFLLFSLAGCLEQGSSADGVIPDLWVECSSAQVYPPYCRNSGEILWIGLSKEFDLDCAAALSSFSTTQRNNQFDAIADNISLSKSGIRVNANIHSWSTPQGAGIGTLPEGSYRACAFIRLSSDNDRMVSGMPYFSGFVDVGGASPQNVNDWISY